MIYFSADHHFWHRNIIGYCNRPFVDIETMNQSLVELHNATVDDGDEVWFLGDVSLEFKRTEPLLNAMKGRLHLVVGNHDPKLLQKWGGWVGVVHRSIVDTEAGAVVVQHHPKTNWPGRKQGIPLFHGHSHNNTRVKVAIDNAYDVGVDCWDFRPVTATEILARETVG